MKDYVGHRKRLRQKFLHAGITAFHDYEIIEFLLTYAIPVKDVKPLAKELLRTFKSVKAVLDAEPEKLYAIPGMGESAVVSILFFKSLMEYYAKEQAATHIHLPSTKATIEFLKISLGGLKKEVFKVLFLNNRNQLIEEKTMYRGTVDQAAVYPREIMVQALSFNATRIIVSHNHPSGSLNVSEADWQITQELLYAALPLGIDILDHIIIGEGGYVSFAESGHIDALVREYKALPPHLCRKPRL